MTIIIVNVWNTWMLELPTKKQFKAKNSSVGDYLLFCNHSASYDNFSTLTREKKDFTKIETESVTNGI